MEVHVPASQRKRRFPPPKPVLTATSVPLCQQWREMVRENDRWMGCHVGMHDTGGSGVWVAPRGRAEKKRRPARHADARRGRQAKMAPKNPLGATCVVYSPSAGDECNACAAFVIRLHTGTRRLVGRRCRLFCWNQSGSPGLGSRPCLKSMGSQR